MVIKIIASRSTLMALPPYQTSWKSTKVGSGETQTDRWTGDFISQLSFLESMQKMDLFSTDK
jgi:hypothetical protein